MTKIILVLGIHRSGSSCVAGVLNRGGVHTGDRMLGPTVDNPRGHFENRDFLELNDRVIGNWREPNPAPTKAQLDEYAALVAGLADHPVAAIKDPRLCFTAQYIASHCQHLAVIAVERSFEAATQSLAKREGTSYARAYEIQREHLEAREVFLTSLPESQRGMIEYDRLIEFPDALVPFLLDFAYADTGLAPTADQLERAIRFVDPDLRHHEQQRQPTVV